VNRQDGSAVNRQDGSAVNRQDGSAVNRQDGSAVNRQDGSAVNRQDGSAVKRQLAVAVAGCAAAGGLILLAASRTWAEVMTHQIAPLPPVTDEQTGAELHGWLPAVGFVALAGAGALVATRGWLRVALGVLLTALGLTATGTGIRDIDGGLWPAVCAAAGVALAAVGVLTARRGRSWSSLGTRYERPGETVRRETTAGRETTEELWEAIDRGEDPTR
jgi:hypothetical protein